MKKLLSILLLLTVATAYAQQQNLPLNREFNLVNQKVFNSKEVNVHTSLQPINQSSILFNTEATKENTPDGYLMNLSKTYRKDRSWFMRKLFFENFLIVDTGNFYLTVDPLLNGEYGMDGEDTSDKTFYKNTRGIIVRANVGEKFSFETSVYENQMVVPNYIDWYIQSHNGDGDIIGVMPGQGRVKSFKDNGYDFSASSAVITYSPAKFLNLQLGTGKHFIGDGYRSLLLSDFSFNYPFIKATATFGKENKFQYTKLNGSLSSVMRRNLSATPEALFVRKSMSTHYFSWLTTKWLNIGLFETTMWNTEDTTGTKPYVAQQLNPVIGVNTLTTASHERHHSNIGLNVKVKLPANTIIYGQFVMDGNQHEETTGYQIGARFQAFKGLTIQTEYNVMSNPNNTTFEPNLEAFSNYNEPLAHPHGDDFTEAVGIINYQYKRLFAQVKTTFAELVKTGTKISNLDLHIGYMINPKNNLAFIVGNKLRKQESSLFTHNTNYFYIGIRTNLRNLYDDF